MARKKKAGVGTLSYEIMLETWRKEGRVSRENLSLKALTFDHRLQAREKNIDMDWVKELHGFVKDGAVPPPIIVFRIDGVDYVTNGFHRCGVRKKEGLPNITADVVVGTWQEAVEFATCCNMANGALKMKMEDKKKACWMLMDAGWEKRPTADIGAHVGLNPTTVNKYLTEYYEKAGRQRPVTLVTSAGVTRRLPLLGGPAASAARRGSGRSFAAKVAGKTVNCLADSREEAEANIADVAAARIVKLKAFGDSGYVREKLASRGLWYDTSSSPHAIQGGKCRGFAVTTAIEDINGSFGSLGFAFVIAAVGRAVLLGQYYGLERKVVLVFETLNGHADILSLAKGLGIEFMTLDQFVDAVKADEGEAGAAVAV